MKKNILKVLSLFIAMGSLSSCLKDDSLVLDPDKGVNVIEFKNPAQIASPAGAVLPLYSFAYDLVPAVELPITVNYSGPAAGAPEDITVTVAVGDQAMLDSYNDDQDHEYTVIPTSLYTISATSLTIKKGEKSATTTVTFKPDQFSLTASYALPLVISNVSSGTISGNFGKIIVAVNAKNKWDGRYSATGTFVDALNSGWSIFNPSGYEYYLQTTGANTVAMYDPTYFVTYIQVFRTSPTQLSGFGSFAPVFTFDANNNVTSVTNYYGQPAGNGRSAAINTSGQNKFISGTPGTPGAQLQVSWTMFQPAPTVRAQSNYTFTFLGARP